jgi:hypothetical protein
MYSNFRTTTIGYHFVYIAREINGIFERFFSTFAICLKIRELAKKKYFFIQVLHSQTAIVEKLWRKNLVAGCQLLVAG